MHTLIRALSGRNFHAAGSGGERFVAWLAVIQLARARADRLVRMCVCAHKPSEHARVGHDHKSCACAHALGPNRVRAAYAVSAC